MSSVAIFCIPVCYIVTITISMYMLNVPSYNTNMCIATGIVFFCKFVNLGMCNKYLVVFLMKVCSFSN